jgi:hypothetical protein
VFYVTVYARVNNSVKDTQIGRNLWKCVRDFNIRVVYLKLINFKSVMKVNTQHAIYFLRMMHKMKC